jgi:hypothetical protein
VRGAGVFAEARQPKLIPRMKTKPNKRFIKPVSADSPVNIRYFTTIFVLYLVSH